MARVFLGLGANLGDVRQTLRRALRRLSPHLRLRAVSGLYDTAPVGYLEQPRFLNLVCEAETDLAPPQLLHHVKELERELGRRPSVRYGPRAIDIDILLYDDIVVRTPELTLPHPRLTERAFVLAPLAEIAPTLVIPATGRTVAELLRQVADQDVRRLEGEEGEVDLCTK